MINKKHIKGLEKTIRNDLNYMIRTADSSTCLNVVEYLLNKYENMGLNLKTQRQKYVSKMEVLK